MQRVTRKSGAIVSLVAAATASALFLSAAGDAMAAYTTATTFQEVAPAGGPYPLDNASNWDQGLPDATKLMVLANANSATPANSTTPMTAYAFEYNNTVALSSLGGQPLTLTSTDSAFDAAAKTSPALYYASTGIGDIQINNNLVLGDGSATTGTAYVKADGTNRILIGGSISQAAGTTWGLTILPGTPDYRFRAQNSSGNYLVNRYTFTGPLTINSGASVRTFNNVLPYGPGTPNFQLDGTFTHSLNGQTLIMNALDSSVSTAALAQSGGGGDREILIGANGNNGSFSGAVTSSALRLVKIGAGTQVLNNAANQYQQVTAMEGVLSADSIAVSGTNSALGRGNGSIIVKDPSTSAVLATIGGTVLDGGTLLYTGAAATSDRAFDVSFRGGTLDASGTGAVQINGAEHSTDEVRVYGDAVASGTSDTMTNAYGIKGLGSLASQLKIIQTGTGINALAYTTSPVAIDETARTIKLADQWVGTPGNGAGAPRLVLQSTTGLDRTLTLTGTNTDDNTIGGAMADSTLGGKLNIAKTGTGTWVLAGANTYTGTTTVSDGTLKLATSWKPAGAVNVTGGTLQLAPGHGNNIVLTGPVPTLSGTGKIDVGDNKMVTPDATGSWNGTAYTGVTGLVASGKIMSSSATSKLNAVAVAKASDILGAGGGTFGGQSVAATDTLVMYTYGGDANMDGKINIDDYGKIDGHVAVPGATDWVNGDFNYDGKINIDDYGIIDGNIAAQGAPIATAPGALAGVTAVPEPASLGLVALAGGSLLVRRRRRA